jgi:hypothetical protein
VEGGGIGQLLQTQGRRSERQIWMEMRMRMGGCCMETTRRKEVYLWFGSKTRLGGFSPINFQVTSGDYGRARYVARVESR